MKNSFSDDFILLEENQKLRQFLDKEYGRLFINEFNSQVILEDVLDGKSVRRIFDSERRIISKEVWSIGKTVATSKLEQKEEYFYALKENQSEEVEESEDLSESKNPPKFLEKVNSQDFLLGTKFETHFNEDGLKLSEKKSVEVKTESSDKKKSEIISEIKSEFRLASETSWQYDSKNRLIRFERTVFPENLETGKKFSEKRELTYKDGFSEPDFVYFENDLVRLKREYFSPQEYLESAFFDRGISVETLWRNGKKIESIQKLNDRIQNKVVYETE